jgi:hypothetical protein
MKQFFPESIANSEAQPSREEKFMQSLAFLWFELRMTQQYLREKTFRPAQVPADAANLSAAIGTPGTRSDKGIRNRKKQNRLPWIILRQGAG